MVELDKLIEYCYYEYNANSCSYCHLNNYCDSNCYIHGHCDNCLDHILHSESPRFHYSCERITHFYVLKFFDRFSSEILRFFEKCHAINRDISVVSLGCGPGTELYGIVEGLRRVRKDDFILNYRGYDKKGKIWENVQKQTESLFSGTNCNVSFSQEDMFTDLKNSDSRIDVIIMNYLLSDCVKYCPDKKDLINFLDQIVQFILDHHISMVVFNDINYYGYSDLDSGVKCMQYICSKLNLFVHQVKTVSVAYPEDSYVPSGWILWENNNVLFDTDTSKTSIASPWTKCRSKFMVSKITF